MRIIVLLLLLLPVSGGTIAFVIPARLCAVFLRTAMSSFTSVGRIVASTSSPRRTGTTRIQPSRSSLPASGIGGSHEVHRSIRTVAAGLGECGHV